MKKKKKVKRKLKTPQQKALGNYYKLTCMKVQEELLHYPQCGIGGGGGSGSVISINKHVKALSQSF